MNFGSAKEGINEHFEPHVRIIESPPASQLQVLDKTLVTNTREKSLNVFILQELEQLACFRGNS